GRGPFRPVSHQDAALRSDGPVLVPGRKRSRRQPRDAYDQIAAARHLLSSSEPGGSAVRGGRLERQGGRNDRARGGDEVLPRGAGGRGGRCCPVPGGGRGAGTDWARSP